MASLRNPRPAVFHLVKESKLGQPVVTRAELAERKVDWMAWRGMIFQVPFTGRVPQVSRRPLGLGRTASQGVGQGAHGRDPLQRITHLCRDSVPPAWVDGIDDCADSGPGTAGSGHHQLLALGRASRPTVASGRILKGATDG